MMTNPSQLFDDLAQMASGAGGAFVEAKREVEQSMRAQMSQMLQQMNLVTREEFDAVKEMAANARSENETLRSEIKTLKSSLST